MNTPLVGGTHVASRFSSPRHRVADGDARSAAAGLTGSAAPRTGWISGSYHGLPLSLTLDRRAQTVSGQAVGQTVSVQTTPDGTHVQGSEGPSGVDLTQDWQPTHLSQAGTARDGDVSVSFDWDQSQGSGTVGGQPFSSQWDASGHVTGEAFGGSIDMQYDAASGHLQGTLGSAPMQATITNLDLTDFMGHVYLLAP